MIPVRFEKLHGQPEWAATAEQRRKRRRKKKRRGEPCDDTESESERGTDSGEEDGDILKRTGNLLSQSVDSLPKGTIDLKRMKDANSAKRAQAVVRSVEFHPTASVLLTAGYHKTVDLFQVCVWLKCGNPSCEGYLFHNLQIFCQTTFFTKIS